MNKKWFLCPLLQCVAAITSVYPAIAVILGYLVLSENITFYPYFGCFYTGPVITVWERGLDLWCGERCICVRNYHTKERKRIHTESW